MSLWHHAAFLLNFNACHQFTYHVQFQSRSIAWVHCMGPLHGSIAWVHCILNSLTKSWWKSLKRSLRWNWLVEKVYILWVWQTNPAERYIAPSGAFQILQHVCVQSPATCQSQHSQLSNTVKMCLPKASYRKHPGNPLDVSQVLSTCNTSDGMTSMFFSRKWLVQ